MRFNLGDKVNDVDELKMWDKKPTYRTVNLQNEDVIHYKLEFGYEIQSIKGIEASIDEGKEFTITYRILELLKDGEIVFSSEDTQSEKVGFEMSTPYQIFPFVKPYIESHEDKEKSEWIRRSFTPKQEDIPPWDRYDEKQPENNKPTFIDLTIDLSKEDPTFNDLAKDILKNPTILDNKIFSSNDRGNAARFKEECDGFLIYSEDSKKWFAWVINHWEEAKTKTGKAAAFVVNTFQAEYKYLESKYETLCINEEKYKEHPYYNLIKKSLKKAKDVAYKNAINAPNERKMNSMLNVAANTTMSVDFSMNSETKYISCKNGILDTKTGEFIENWRIERIDSIKKEYPVNYVDCTYTPGIKSKKFIEHLKKICYDNTTPNLSDEEREKRMFDLGYYLRIMIAYLLYPGNPHRIFMFWWGKGKNGKSITVMVLKDIFTDLYSDPNIQELYVSGDDRPRSSTARALSKRIAFYDEAEDDENEYKGGRVSIGMVKNLTGDSQTSRFRMPYEAAKPREVICTPIGITNEIPHFDKEIDQAMTDRISIINFNHRFTDDETIENYHEQLLEERDSIFSMIIDDYRNNLKDGRFQLPIMPEFMRRSQRTLLAGYPYADYVESRLKQSEYDISKERVTRKDIERDFILFCEKHHIDCKTRWKENGSESGYCELVEKEKKKLFKALRIYGFEEQSSHNEKYFKGCSFIK